MSLPNHPPHVAPLSQAAAGLTLLIMAAALAAALLEHQVRRWVQGQGHNCCVG
ncbi:MAG TPA: hypothetical protein VFR55_03860 [Dehalococcoidia bacterium]|nr:hypothetical protein [Dehalococcoidia bacterium]